jgi:hypothetical protein
LPATPASGVWHMRILSGTRCPISAG